MAHAETNRSASDEKSHGFVSHLRQPISIIYCCCCSCIVTEKLFFSVVVVAVPIVKCVSCVCVCVWCARAFTLILLLLSRIVLWQTTIIIIVMMVVTTVVSSLRSIAFREWEIDASVHIQWHRQHTVPQRQSLGLGRWRRNINFQHSSIHKMKLYKRRHSGPFRLSLLQTPSQSSGNHRFFLCSSFSLSSRLRLLKSRLCKLNLQFLLNYCFFMHFWRHSIAVNHGWRYYRRYISWVCGSINTEHTFASSPLFMELMLKLREKCTIFFETHFCRRQPTAAWTVAQKQTIPNRRNDMANEWEWMRRRSARMQKF